jgi:hypothetical protein
MGIEIITRTRADCMHAPAIRPIHASAELVCAAVSQHAAFENRRCRETPLWKRCASRRSIAACRCLDRRGASFSPRAWRRHVVGTLPSFGATLPLPHPCPSSSPFSIGHDGFFRLHRLEPSRPRDARRSIRCAPNAGAILARADISLYSSFYRRYRLSEPCCQRRASSPGRTQ